MTAKNYLYEAIKAIAETEISDDILAGFAYVDEAHSMKHDEALCDEALSVYRVNKVALCKAAGESHEAFDAKYDAYEKRVKEGK